MFIGGNTYAQDYPFNDTNWWERLAYEEQPAITDFSGVDTSIIVVSNRYKTENKLRFMSEVRGEGKMMYFFVYAYKGKWRVLETKNLQEAINYMPDRNRDWVVYTEGMGKIFTAELNRGMMMTSQYGVNVIMLDYPSITSTKKTSGNYLFSIKNARHAYKDHVPVLEEIKSLRQKGKMGKGNLSLFFHSMGNYLMQQTVKKGKLTNLNDTKWVNNVILNAACVPQHNHRKWLNQINFAHNIYVLYNPEDKTLKWPEIINKKKQLGRTLKNPVSSKAHYINFNKLVGDGHSYFLVLRGRTTVHPTVKKYYDTILHGKTVDLSNGGFSTSKHRNIGLDIMP